jgi:hypothetical protein
MSYIRTWLAMASHVVFAAAIHKHQAAAPSLPFCWEDKSVHQAAAELLMLSRCTPCTPAKWHLHDPSLR